MLHGNGLHPDGIQRQESVLIDGLLRNGTDRSAPWRAHVRELTLARQAAERRYARPELQARLDRPAYLALARERAVALRLELARLNAEHQTWLREHGVDVVERRTRRPRSPGTTQQ